MTESNLKPQDIEPFDEAEAALQGIAIASRADAHAAEDLAYMVNLDNQPDMAEDVRDEAALSHGFADLAKAQIDHLKEQRGESTPKAGE